MSFLPSFSSTLRVYIVCSTINFKLIMCIYGKFEDERKFV